MELIKIQNDGLTYGLSEEVILKISEFEKQLKSIKEQEEKIKLAILNEMENKNIVKLDTDVLTITYVESTDRETFDSKKFKEEHQDLYDEYIKITPVKSSIRIKVK